MPYKSILLLIIILSSFTTIGQNITLKVIGNNDTETKTIDTLPYQKKHVNLKSVTREIDSLSRRLNAIGYMEHSIEPMLRENDSTIISKIHLNQKYHTIHIYYDSNRIPASILQYVSKHVTPKYFVLPFSKTESTLEYLNGQLANQGNPFLKLKLTNIAIEYDVVKAYLITTQISEPRTIDRIILKGYTKFPSKYISRYAHIKTETIFNLSDIITKAERLNELPFANQIRDPEVLFTKDSTTLYIYVEKIKSNSFDGYLGFTTNETTKKLEFSGYLDMILRNNLNFGESITLNYRSDENNQRNFNLKLDAPYIFKSPIGTHLELNILKKDSTFTTIDQALKLYYQFTPKHKVFLGLRTTQSNDLLNTNPTTNVADYKATFLESEYNFLNRALQHKLFPIQTSIDLQVGTGNRELSNTKQKQSRFKLNGYHSFYLNKKNSIYTKIEGASLISDDYLDNELFRFGGINSIRGFEENSLTATLYGVLNLEYRYQLNPTIYIHSITDFGYLENQIFNQKEKLLGLGVGFAILTKAGLLKFNYANGQTQNTPFNISNSKIHISITTIF